jgi:DNA-binding NarL/FixJ family response regulator
MKTSILIADDHPIFREGLRGLLEREPEMTVVGEASNGEEAVSLARELHPDVVIMDITMPGVNGIEATRRILMEQDDIRVVVLSMESGRRFVVEALEAGVVGYMLKDSFFNELASAVRTVVNGDIYFSPNISELIIRDYLKCIPTHVPLTHDCLTDRERQLVQLIADGKNTKEIAGELGVSQKTVDVHRMNVMKKLNLFSAAELTKYAIREGLTSVD